MLLSVCVLTYNHEKYIAQALESVLMQKTDFDFEVLVGEDCSTDGTADIVRAYAAKDSRIKPYFSPVNTHAYGTIEHIRLAAQGEYVAWLEGDDYWTDPQKLQKQVDFLEKNPEYIACSHDVSFVDEHGNAAAAITFKRFSPQRQYTLCEAAAGYLPGHGGSALMYRNIFKGMAPEIYAAFTNCKSVGDMRIAQFLTLFGPLYRMPDVMAVYRHVTHSGESFSARTSKQNLSLDYLFWAQERQKMAETILNREISFYVTYRDTAYHACVEWLQHPNRENARIFREVFRQTEHKCRTAGYILLQILMFPVRKVSRKLHHR